MKSRIFPALAGCLLVLSGLLMGSCKETSNIGGSLVQEQLMVVVDSAYTVSGHSVALTAVRSRTTDQLLGSINVPGYGQLSSSVVTQFLSATTLDSTFTAADLDSIVLNLQYAVGGFIGDSVAPMGLSIYELTRALPSPIFSNFDPAGYYKSTPMARVVYNASTMESDSLKSLLVRSIRVKLPREFGQELYRAYEEHPEYYSTPELFNTHVFPGFYLANSFGSGRMTLVQRTTMRMYLRHISEAADGTRDTVSGTHDYYMVTPEVLSNNNLDYTIDPALTAKAEGGAALMVAPCGYETELVFPTREVIASYRNAPGDIKLVNSLSFSIPTDSIANDYQVGIPPYALLVRKDKRDEFFANNNLPDNISSFYASYDSTTKQYSFSSMRGYLMEMLSKETVTEDDCTFILCPVTVNFEQTTNTSYYGTTSSVESSVVPYVMSPAMVELRLDKSKINFTYSLQSQN